MLTWVIDNSVPNSPRIVQLLHVHCNITLVNFDLESYCFLYSVLTPLQAIGILLWYVIREIVDNEDETWYKYSRASLIMVLTQVMMVI